MKKIFTITEKIVNPHIRRLVNGGLGIFLIIIVLLISFLAGILIFLFVKFLQFVSTTKIPRLVLTIMLMTLLIYVIGLFIETCVFQKNDKPQHQQQNKEGNKKEKER